MRDAINGMNGGQLDGFNITVSLARPRRKTSFELAQEIAMMIIAKEKKMAGL